MRTRHSLPAAAHRQFGRSGSALSWLRMLRPAPRLALGCTTPAAGIAAGLGAGAGIGTGAGFGARTGRPCGLRAQRAGLGAGDGALGGSRLPGYRACVSARPAAILAYPSAQAQVACAQDGAFASGGLTRRTRTAARFRAGHAKLRCRAGRQFDHLALRHRPAPFDPDQNGLAAVERGHFDIAWQRQGAMRDRDALPPVAADRGIADRIVIHLVDRGIASPHRRHKAGPTTTG